MITLAKTKRIFERYYICLPLKLSREFRSQLFIGLHLSANVFNPQRKYLFQFKIRIIIPSIFVPI